ncbi:IS701 family transposase [Streptomyces sp. NPDC087300]|uniref:IS701 family transposase n=1 Tax=Streptomyces sp. NPDC087300 TaxID=3365780 RepID=UPI00382CD043
MPAHDLTLTQRMPSASEFADQVFGSLPRADQRHWGRAYVMALLATEGKKTVRRLASSVSASATASQSMHQFVNASPWEWMPARAELTRWVAARIAPQAWVLDVAVLRKRGDHSCGVHRRFLPEAGRSVNCQVGVGAFLAGTAREREGAAAVPVDWRLLLHGGWAEDPERRARARVPSGIRPQPVGQYALDLVDAGLGGRRLGSLPVVADLTGHPGTSTLVRQLVRRGRDFVVAVPGTMPVLPAEAVRVGAGRTGGGSPASPAAGAAPVEAWTCLSPSPNDNRRYDSRDRSVRRPAVLSGLVQLPGVRPPLQRVHRLVALRHVHAGTAPRLWLTNLVHRRPDELLALASLAARAGAATRRMEDDYGLLDFEGRSYPGWHHHMTLVSAAHAYGSLGGEALDAAA